MTQQNQETQKLMETYDAGPEQLDAALAGLSESQLDLARAAGKWTIRQIVHHIVDTENFWEAIIWAALGHSGRTYDISWLILDNKCAEPLNYATRPIEDSVALFKALRRYISNMVNHIPGALERNLLIAQTIETYQENLFSVQDMLNWQIKHLDLHMKQIRETRELHGI